LDASPSFDPAWRAAGLRYHSRSFFCRKKFGRAVWKVSLDAGCTCPNRDGTLATGGCIFCDPESFSPSRRLQGMSIAAQLDEGIRQVRNRHRAADMFVAYFQPATNTYGPPEYLRRCYEEALAHPNVVGLAIGTRPDCVPDAVLKMLAELAQTPEGDSPIFVATPQGGVPELGQSPSPKSWITIEYGLQTIHDRTLDWLNRGHHFDAFIDAAERSRRLGLEIGVHVILGLPGESRDDMLATARQIARLGVGSVKIHNLYAVRNTRLAEMLAAGEVRLPERDEYVSCVADFLEVLPPNCVIDRLSGDAPRTYLVGPQWCLDKSAIRTAVIAELARRDSWQGRRA
jgi:radical SAM superfamily enzyme